MAASFPFLHSTFLLDSDFLQNTTTSIPKMPYGLMDDHIINSNNCFYNNYPSHDHEILHQQMDAAAGISSIENNNTIIRSPPLSSSHDEQHDGQSMSEKYKTTTDSSSMVIQLDEDNDDDEQEIHKKNTIDQNKRRKNRDGSCLISGQSKDLKETKAKKQKKCNGGLKETDEQKKKKTKTEKKNQLKGVSDEVVPPTGYIHVRARRGQATDSHSLAERVRREKISERMKLLQSLVPGCDKVTGKALMLDEIINYVQSLQNQVEFLSMKLSSVNHPVFHDFGAADLDAFMVKSEKMSDFVSPLPYMQQSSTTSSTTSADQLTAFADNTTTFTTRHNYPSLEFHQGHRSNAFSSQVNESLLMDVDDQRQMFINQSWFNHLCSFQ